MVQQRTREIGIRKVFGASVISILSLLTRDITRLVIISSLIALPVAVWLIRYWLDSYAVKIALSWWVLFPIGALLLITLLTISYQTLRAAYADPVSTLRQD